MSCLIHSIFGAAIVPAGRGASRRLPTYDYYSDWEDATCPERPRSVGIRRPRKLLRPLVTLLLALMAIMGWVSGSQAGGASTDDAEGSAWEFSVSPYFWAARIEGESGTLPGLPPADVDESFSDIWDDLDFAGMVAGSARKGRFVISGGLQYVEISATDNSLAPIFGSEKLTSKTFILDALGEYIVFEEGRSNLLLSGGARLWSVETNLKVSTGLLPGRKINGDDTWVDPVLGMRGNVDIVSAVNIKDLWYHPKGRRLPCRRPLRPGSPASSPVARS